MSTMNISLPGSLKSFVDEQVEARGYSTSSEYVRELTAGTRTGSGCAPSFLKAQPPRSRVPPTRPISNACVRARGDRGRRAGVKRLVQRERARRDIDEALDCSRDEAGEAVALRFVADLGSALLRIARHPAIGSPRYAHELDVPGLGTWRLGRHPYLVIYVEREEHIEVWRVLHGERDIPAWLREGG